MRKSLSVSEQRSAVQIPHVISHWLDHGRDLQRTGATFAWVGPVNIDSNFFTLMQVEY
jgi:hypothetical protein